MEQSKKWREYCLDALFFGVGSLLYAVSVNVFTSPNHIAPGGLTGIATVLHYLIGTPIGTVILILNIPLLLAAWKVLGLHFVLKTGIATVLVSVVMDTSVLFLKPYQGDTLLAALYGGVLSGVGLSCFFLRGATTGGTDIAGRLIQRRFPHMAIGRLLLIMDVFVVIFAVICYRNLNNGLYAMIAIFTSTKVIDSVLYGTSSGRMLVIVSEQQAAIAQAIHTLGRGVTLLPAKGGYTHQEKDVLLCAVRPNEVAKLQKIVTQADPHAFTIVLEASEIMGEGFVRSRH